MARSYNISSQATDSQPVKSQESNENKKSYWHVIPVILAVGAVIAGAAFGVVKLQEHNEDVTITRTWEEIKSVADASVTEEETSGETVSVESGWMQSSDPMKRVINWDGILAVNKDIKCWIYIPETNIDYPVLQPSTWSENQYYLKHDVYDKSSSAGSIYMPAEVEGFEDRDVHQIIIGHNMRNGSMFSSLINYKDKGFWEVTPYIYLYYPDRTEKWMIYSPYHTKQSDDIYNMPYEAGTVLYQNLLDDIESKKAYDTATNGPTVNSPLLTLTTCDRTSTEGSDGRFVVNAKLVDTVTTSSTDDTSMSGDSSVSQDDTVKED